MSDHVTILGGGKVIMAVDVEWRAIVKVLGLDDLSEGRSVRELGIEGIDVDALSGLLLRSEGLWGEQH